MPILIRNLGFFLGATLPVAGGPQVHVLVMNRFWAEITTSGRATVGDPLLEYEKVGGNHLGSILGACALQ